MIIGLTGRKRSGKSTAARYLVENHGFVELSFAEPLKRMALAIDPVVYAEPSRNFYGKAVYDRLSTVVARDGWEAAKDRFSEVRRFLQRLGTEGVRGHIGQDTWVNLAEDEIKRTWGITDHGFIPGDVPEPPIVFADVRFENEAALIRDWGGVVVEVYRPSQGDPEPEHSSEAGVTADCRMTNVDGKPSEMIRQLDYLLMPQRVTASMPTEAE